MGMIILTTKLIRKKSIEITPSMMQFEEKPRFAKVLIRLWMKR